MSASSNSVTFYSLNSIPKIFTENVNVILWHYILTVSTAEIQCCVILSEKIQQYQQ